MRTQKKNILKQKLLLVALLAGFTSNIAYAVGEPGKDGMSLADLNKVVKDLDVRREENKLIIAGFIPARCAQGLFQDYRTEAGKHMITIRMPNCEGEFSPRAGEKYVDLADHLPPYSIKDASGEFHLRHYKNVSKNARPEDKQVVEVLKDTRSDKPIAVEGSEEIAKKESDKEEADRLEAEAKEKAELEKDEALANEERAKAEYQRLTNLEKKLGLLCRQGDFGGVRDELARNAKWFGDVSELLAGLENTEFSHLLKKLEEAETAEEAREIYEQLLAIASQLGQNTKKIKNAYVEKRIDLIKIQVEEAGESKADLRKAQAAIAEFDRDMRSIDRRAYSKGAGEGEQSIKEYVGWLYSEIGAKAIDMKDFKLAKRFFKDAKKRTDKENGLEMDKTMAKSFLREYDKCIEKSKQNGRFSSCDKFKEAAREEAESVGETLAELGGESAQEDLSNFQIEYVQAFGRGGSVKVGGPIGSITQMPGQLDQAKIQAYQEYQMNQQQMMMQRMYGGGMMQAASAGGGGFLSR